MIIVDATVVEPDIFCATTIGRSRLEIFWTSSSVAKKSISSLVRPTLILPLIIAIVAGIASLALTVSSTIKAVSIFLG